MKTMPMDDVENLHRQLWHRPDWFAPDAMRFFNTKLESDGLVADSGDIYFITSEKGPGMPRRFSVRKMDGKTGEVDTVGLFNRHANYTVAEAAARSAMNGGEMAGGES
ncbi:MAG: DUF7447 family protein [Silanimonas sp.]